VLYQKYRQAGVSASEGTRVPNELAIGYGVKPVSTARQFEGGTLEPTGSPLDMAIEGDGFFQVQYADGTTVYTRDGSFNMGPDGRLVNGDGFYLDPEITIPEDAVSVSIGVDGTIQVMQFGQDEPTDVGQIELARFVNPAGLSAIGRNLYRITAASGDPITDVPGQNGLGNINQGYLEMSNVSVVDEMVNMIVAQRAYEMNSKAIQTADEMSGIANNLKR
jgi:flagellar basal-body rod protein FlgG